MPFGGLPKGLYAQHHCCALDGFKLGGLFLSLSVIKIILFWRLLTYYHIYLISYYHVHIYAFEQNVFFFYGLYISNGP